MYKDREEKMNCVNYISNIAIPISIFIIIGYGIISKINIFDTFLSGVNQGIKVVFGIFPTLIGLFLAIELLSISGILDFIISLMSPILNLFKIPKEIMPVAILRPISGSGSIAVSTEIMKKYGVDSKIGLIVSTIMGSTETILYTIAIYTSSINIKKSRFVLWVSLISSMTAMLVSVVIWRILS